MLIQMLRFSVWGMTVTYHQAQPVSKYEVVVYLNTFQVFKHASIL